MIIKSIEPQTDPLWQTLVQQQESDVFHAPDWTKVLSATYNFDLRALVALDETDQPRAGIAYGKIEDMMDPRITSLPFSDFCDPLVNDPAHWEALITRLLAEDCRLSFRCLHNETPLHDKRLKLVNRARWHCVDLRRNEDGIWAGLHGSARRAIRKARRSGVVMRAAQDKNDLRAFFELHLKVRKYKYHLLAQPYRFF